MPFKSEQQKRFMWAKHPEVARKWTSEGKGNVMAGNTPPWMQNNNQNDNGGDDKKSRRRQAIQNRLKRMHQGKGKPKGKAY